MWTCKAINSRHTGASPTYRRVIAWFTKSGKLNKANTGIACALFGEFVVQLKLSRFESRWHTRCILWPRQTLAHNHHFSSSNWQIFTQLFLGPLGTVSRSLTKKTIVQEAERETHNETMWECLFRSLGATPRTRSKQTLLSVQGDPQLLPQSFPTNYASQGESHLQHVTLCSVADALPPVF